jgi:drug/metabolite transporter (DMT)-like permease
MITKNKTLFANLAMMSAALIWGSTFIVIKHNLSGVNAVSMIFYRFLMATLIMAVILLFMRKKFWQHFGSGLILALLLFISYTSQTLSLCYIKAAEGGFIAGLFVIFVPLLSFIRGREKLHLDLIIAIILSTIGLWLIAGGVKEFDVGDFLMILSAFAATVYVLYADSIVKKCDVLVLNFQQFFVATVLGLLMVLFFKLPLNIADSSTAWWILYLALFANVICYLVQLGAQKVVSPTVLALTFSLESVFAAIFAWTIGGEKIIMSDLVGGIMILIAIIFVQFKTHVKE